MRAEVIHGDAYTVLRDIPDATIDAIITDPPYKSGGRTSSERTRSSTLQKYVTGKTQRTIGLSDFAGDNRDQRGYVAWLTLILTEGLRASRPGASSLVFCDFRQLPATSDAIQAAGWTWRGVVVWHKPIARPHRGGFRRSTEFVLWATNGPINAEANPVYLDGMYTVSQPRGADRQHITAKPLALMRELVKICPPGGTILDPFAGSGSTGVAAVAEHRNFIGVEITDFYAEIASRRLAEAAAEQITESAA